MRHRDPNRYADRVVFWVCVIAAFYLYTNALYDYAFRHGATSKVCAQKSMYDMTPKQLRRMIRYEKAKEM